MSGEALGKKFIFSLFCYFHSCKNYAYEIRLETMVRGQTPEREREKKREKRTRGNVVCEIWIESIV